MFDFDVLIIKKGSVNEIGRIVREHPTLKFVRVTDDDAWALPRCDAYIMDGDFFFADSRRVFTSDFIESEA